MPGPVSDSYDPEFSTGANADDVREAIQEMAMDGNVGLTKLEREIMRLLEGCRGEGNALRRRNLVEMLAHVAGERKIREAIKHLVLEHGIPIASGPGGYYTPVTTQEVQKAGDYYHSYAMACLTVESRLRRCSLPEIVEQLKLDFATEGVEGAGENKMDERGERV